MKVLNRPSCDGCVCVGGGGGLLGTKKKTIYKLPGSSHFRTTLKRLIGTRYCSEEALRLTRRQNFRLVQIETNCRRHFKVHLKWKISTI